MGMGPFGNTATNALEWDGGWHGGLRYKKLDQKLLVLPQFLENHLLLEWSNFWTMQVRLEDDTEGFYCWFFVLGAYQHVAMVAIGGVDG